MCLEILRRCVQGCPLVVAPQACQNGSDLPQKGGPVVYSFKQLRMNSKLIPSNVRQLIGHPKLLIQVVMFIRKFNGQPGCYFECFLNAKCLDVAQGLQLIISKPKQHSTKTLHNYQLSSLFQNKIQKANKRINEVLFSNDAEQPLPRRTFDTMGI